MARGQGATGWSEECPSKGEAGDDRQGGPRSKKKVILAPLHSVNETGEELVTDRGLAQKRGGTLRPT